MMLATTRPSERQRSSAADPALEKRSLASILRDHGPMAVVDAVDIALDVCDELASAHTNGIVHGDLRMHRVRTHWPRRPGQRVDIFALGENDSAAFSFRASAVAGLVAPEQRDNRAVDIRADVWAVGAMLHSMLAGVAPTGEPVERTLGKAPRALAATIQACLDVEPSKRPQSVDELAGAIASFASSPPERFEQLARRRGSLQKAKRVRSDLGDVERALGRLDDAALQRELALAASPPEGALDRLMFTVQQSTGSAVFEKSVPMIDLADLADEEENIATVLASSRYTTGDPLEEAIPQVVSPLSVAPVVLSSELLAPPKEPEVRTVPMTMTTSPGVHVRPASGRTPPWKIALGLVGAAAALAFGVGIGMQMVERAMTRQPAPRAEATVASASDANPAGRPSVQRPSNEPAATTAAAPTTRPATTTAAAPATKPAATTAVAPTTKPTSTSGASPVTGTPAIVTPDALPDAPLVTVASLPDAHLATPASLPDARPVAPVAARARSRPSSVPATREDGASSETAVSPSSLADALR